MAHLGLVGGVQMIINTGSWQGSVEKEAIDNSKERRGCSRKCAPALKDFSSPPYPVHPRPQNTVLQLAPPYVVTL